MDITITIPDELKEAVAIWEADHATIDPEGNTTTLTLADWLASIAVGNLEALVKARWVEQEYPKLDTATVVEAVKAVALEVSRGDVETVAVNEKGIVR